ncbi:CotH kinase family protein [Nannocystis bainbridge]|uniref:CotH kinase family protein n=1 Tax=Nannocystis bainbridge TaxID=2995303 RepID=A0ABT5ECY9_9BACT|nr:CotH kinase family protein [Nannocystis bainbridge]MDC0723758.1 CotH kinase family protein [Nannocystis bainbridge]
MRPASAVFAVSILAGCPDPPAADGDSDGGTSTTSPPPAATTTGEAATTGSTSESPASDGGTASGEPAGTTGDPPGTTTGEPAWQPKGCPEFYAQERLPTVELEIDPPELAGLEQEWAIADDDDLKEHPLLSFKVDDTVITDASVRLRGNASHWHDQKKMQFEVSFNTYDDAGRFEGLKHVLFDAAEYNRSFLRDRLALAILRDVGLAAPCANNIRVVVNGAYYGLFTNIEKVDSEFLERNFAAPRGNLYKRGGGGSGWDKKTNEEDPSEADVEQLNAAETVADLLAVMNLEQALLEWATEAVIPDRDGAWGGGLNQYVYNDPSSGFVVIPWDLDDTFTRLEPDTDPYTYIKENHHGRPFYAIATADPAWFARYVEAIAFAVATGYDVAVLQDRLDTWAAQIAAAAADDPNRPFTLEQHLDQVEDMRAFVAERRLFLDAWLHCWQSGGVDGDHDGLCDGP